MKLAVLLASYNGETYIREQIDSVLAQTYRGFNLLIRDDGSGDATFQIEKQYEEKYPDKITVYQREGGESGAKCNFWELCRIAGKQGFDYVMFCDQDDIWMPDKIEKTLVQMKKVEKTCGEVPVLVHTDLEVVDGQMQTISPSYVVYRAIDSGCKDLNRLLMQNNVTGCTMMVNKKLLEEALKAEDPGAVAMHDWWFALVAALKGRISFLPESTVRYRQHDANVVGATKVNSFSFMVKRLKDISHVKKTFQLAVAQADLLVRCFSGSAEEKTLEPARQLAALYTHGKPGRIHTVLKYRLLKYGAVQIAGEILFI